MTADRDFVTPPRVALLIDGCELEITPIVVGEVFELLQLVEPIVDDLALMDAAVLDRVALAQLLGRVGEPLLRALALCTRGHWRGEGGERRHVAGAEHLEWLRNLLLDRAAELLAVCVEVNRDFFGQAMPALRTLPARLGWQAAAPPAPSPGPTPSSR